MKFHGDIELNENELQQVVVQKETAFPSTAKIGRLSFIDQVLYMCVDLNGTDPIWYPLTNKINTYEHIQSTPATTWNVIHNLNSSAPIVQVMENGSILIPESVAVVDKNNITITFGTAVSGTATVMFGNVLSPIGTGILHTPLSGEKNFIIITSITAKAWRLKVLSVTTSNNNDFGLDIISLFDENDNNVSLGVNASGFASTYYNNDSSLASKIFDQPTSGYFSKQNNFTSGDVVGAIFPNPITVKYATVDAHSSNNDGLPKDVMLEYSNDTTTGFDGTWQAFSNTTTLFTAPGGNQIATINLA